MKKRSAMALLLGVMIVAGIFANGCSDGRTPGNFTDGSRSEDVSGDDSDAVSGDDSSHDANGGLGDDASGKSELLRRKRWTGKRSRRMIWRRRT